MNENILSDNDLTALRDLSEFIYSNPELGLHEFKAASAQKKLLREWGFAVQENTGGLETAFRAEMSFGTGKGPKFAFFTEYDALRNFGHACGHNLITACGMAAARIACLKLREAGADGTLVLFGSPGEEQCAGKVIMRAAGVFDDIDAALAAHPFDISSMDDGTYGVRDMVVKFHGKASHAGMAPQLGINALDAMILFFNGIGAWRQQMPEATRVHGIITNGGSAANIIPDETSAFFYLRSRRLDEMDLMEKRFREIVAGAALQTGCTFDCDCVSAYEPCRINQPLNAAFAEAFEASGEPVRHADGSEGRISTDFGDVSQIVPGAHVHFGICLPEEKGMPLHSEAFRTAAGREYGFQQAVKCASAMADVCVKYFSDPAFRDAVKADFAR